MADRNSTSRQAKARATKAEDRTRTTTTPAQRRKAAASSPEAIEYPRYFLLTMREAGREALGEWLKATGAPAEILNLWRALDTLNACLEDPTIAGPEQYARAFRDVAIGKQIAGVAEWPEFNLQQPNEQEREP